MWANVLQYVGDDGVPVGELAKRARTSRLSLDGLQRWGYVTVDGSSGVSRGSRVSGNGSVVRMTTAGRKAGEIWRPLAAEVEGRWRSRFGEDTVATLREALGAVRDQFDPSLALPRYLPVVYPTQNGKAEVPVSVGAGGEAEAGGFGPVGPGGPGRSGRRGGPVGAPLTGAAAIHD